MRPGDLAHFAPQLRAAAVREVCGAPNTARAADFAQLRILPVQRVPRYELFLRQLADAERCTPPTHRDHAPVVAALAAIGTVARAINTAGKEADQRVRVHAIAAKLRRGAYVITITKPLPDRSMWPVLPRFLPRLRSRPQG